MLSGLSAHELAWLLAAGVLLDLLLGEARRFHPLVGFGELAGVVERRLNQAVESSEVVVVCNPNNPTGEAIGAATAGLGRATATQGRLACGHLAARGLWCRLFTHAARGVRLGLPADEAAWQRLERALQEWSTQ